MVRKGILLSALTAGALMAAGQAQASVKFNAIGGIIEQLHENSSFTANNFAFTICQGGACQTLFTGVTGLRGLNDLNSFNSWANTGSYAGTAGYFDNYKFTFTGVGSFFGNKTTPPPANPQASSAETISQPVAEPGTWAMMILGFGVIGMAMRRRAAASNFA